MRVSGRRDILALAVPILAGRLGGTAPPGFVLSGLPRPVSPFRAFPARFRPYGWRVSLRWALAHPTEASLCA